MAYIQDSSQSFTITLTALLEGTGILTYIYVSNETTTGFGEWTEVGGWVQPIPNVTEGDSIIVTVGVRNDGAVTDNLFGQFVSTQVTPIEALTQEGSVGVGLEADPIGEWSFTMPPNDVGITINAGHVE